VTAPPAGGVTIRDARRGDAGAVFALLDQLGYPQPSVEAVADRIDRLSREPAGRLLVAEAGGEVVAVASLTTVPYFDRDSRFGRLTSVVVRDDARGRGVGERIVRQAEADARRLGCTTMEVTSSRRREGAHAFYRQLGYDDIADRSGLFRKPLGA
jgi:N-acetylglutamate synthase-like GNAT family acetyltransferase